MSDVSTETQHRENLQRRSLRDEYRAGDGDQRPGAGGLSEAARERRAAGTSRRTKSAKSSRPSSRSPNTGCPTRTAPPTCRSRWARPISISGARRCAAWPAKQAPPAIEPSPRDKRFKDPEWKSNQFFDFVMQLYLLTTQWAQELVQERRRRSIRTRARRPSSTSSRSPTRSRRRISSSPIRKCCARRWRRTATIWFAA